MRSVIIVLNQVVNLVSSRAPTTIITISRPVPPNHTRALWSAVSRLTIMTPSSSPPLKCLLAGAPVDGDGRRSARLHRLDDRDGLCQPAGVIVIDRRQAHLNLSYDRPGPRLLFIQGCAKDSFTSVGQRVFHQRRQVPGQAAPLIRGSASGLRQPREWLGRHGGSSLVAKASAGILGWRCVVRGTESMMT